MSVTGLGTARRGARLPILAILSGVMMFVAIVLFAIELGRFAQNRDLLQTDVTVGGVPVTGMKLQEAAAMWQRVYDQPIELDYQGSPIILNPADIGFRTNDELMLAAINSKTAGGSNYWVDFWNYLWRRPTQPIVISLIADYQQAKLRDFLQNVASRYEQPASSANFDLTSMTFGSGTTGTRLDVEASLQAIDQVLRRPTDRKVKLVMKDEGAHSADMQTLKQGILDFLQQKGVAPNGPATLASVVLIDLQSGQEVTINPDIAYSAMSTIKIPILLNIFRKLDFTPDKDTKWLMGASILCSSNSASNYLIQLSGSGGNARDQLASGLAQVTNTAQALGAKNTFIDAPLYVGAKDYQFSVPVAKTAPDTTFDAKADPYSQTTAQDMGAMLQEIYDCSEYGSGIMAVFPDGYTQAECKEMIELLSGNIIGRLIELGVPAGTRVAHKNGWGGASGGADGANVSDAAIIYTPGGNYILSIYMWEAKANQDGIGSLQPWEAIEGISRMAYNYFNTDNPLLVSRVPENALGAVDCVMPNTSHPELLDLNNINNGRFDANGHILPDACFNYPQCSANPSGSAPASDGVNTDAGSQTVSGQNSGTASGSTSGGAPSTTAPVAASTLPPPPPK